MKLTFSCISVCVIGTEPDSKSDLNEWLTGIGVDSDVADKVGLADLQLCNT